ncbi:nitrate- and nitrite sensing domain-containing protein [Zobellella iuensis]|uniref:Nitrate- and nitrite sensing domain-containing protein n=1 Tax=Zobellella iuensis TaxID=2803811 RepID=A0ABS1QRT3_9GAMM|nr:nitrate- and nitrite sensing domain-containing protein [Zobellella iuensis]MBL1377550.1 nitrate- and nitrite sensing domain-containing protein [Zobellella iuensis]
MNSMIIGVLAAVLLGGLWWGWRRRRLQAWLLPQRARVGLDCAADLVALVADMQQHRGMSGAWLAGDQGFAGRLPAKQQAVERRFQALLVHGEREQRERYCCFSREQVAVLQRQWQALVQGLAASTPEQNFQAHCRLVSVLLEWLAAVAEARIEQPGVVPGEGNSERNFGHRLPALAECLGQARALGSSVAARRYCPPVARVRLLFLTGRAESLLAQALAAGGRGAEVDAAQQAVQAFVSALRGRLLAADATGLSATDCFNLGTAAVDAVFRWLEQERLRLDGALSRADRRAPSWADTAPGAL